MFSLLASKTARNAATQTVSRQVETQLRREGRDAWLARRCTQISCATQATTVGDGPRGHSAILAFVANEIFEWGLLGLYGRKSEAAALLIGCWHMSSSCQLMMNSGEFMTRILLAVIVLDKGP
jgi:hypothetical protein